MCNSVRAYGGTAIGHGGTVAAADYGAVVVSAWVSSQPYACTPNQCASSGVGSITFCAENKIEISAKSVAINGVDVLAKFDKLEASDTALNTSYTALKASYTDVLAKFAKLEASDTALNTSYTALKASYTALKAALDESNANTNAAIKALKDACGASSFGSRLTTGCAGDKGTSGDKSTASGFLVGTLLALSLTAAAVA
jgi:hypothetical protein